MGWLMALDEAISDYNSPMIILSEIPFILNEVSLKNGA
jgi:hypothetical protein